MMRTNNVFTSSVAQAMFKLNLQFSQTKFDYEVTKTTTVRVTVSDNSTENPLSSSCDYTLVITDENDNPPVFVDPGVVSVKEDVERGLYFVLYVLFKIEYFIFLLAQLKYTYR